MARFRFGDRIGSGGFGVVKRASLLDASGTVVDEGLAVKFLGEEWLDDDEAKIRFVREVRLLDNELDHMNVMGVVGRNLSASPPWFVMPLAESTLEEELDPRAGDREWVIDNFAQILDGVAHAHDREQPILHRDLKPQNVLFCGDVPKISDFGLGKRLDPEATTLTKTAMWMGTEPYMAPEQFQDAKRVGPPADVYALGKILWQMLTGRVPEILYVELDAVPREFRFFIEKCCRRDPGERYRSAVEAAAAFSVFRASPETVDPPLEGAERIVAQWAEADDDEARLELVRRLDDHLARNEQEEELYFKAIPRIPEQLVDLYMDELPDSFAARLHAYDGHITGGLPFTYCDVVADFYVRIFRRSDDLDLQRMILARLLVVGSYHNRWYVGEVVARLIGEIDARDVSTAMMVADVVRSAPHEAEWFWDPWVKAVRLAKPIGDAFAAVTAAS